MKKHILLTTTAMLLSAVAMKTNAEPTNTAALKVNATFVNPLEMLSEKYLGFGIILADEGGKKVVVTPKGELGEGSDATMMSTASYANYYKNGSYGNVGMGFSGSFNAGLVRVKNAGIISGDYEFSDIAKVTLSSETLELMTYDGSTVCGVVDDFKTEASMEGDDGLIYVGGTLTTADLSNATSTVGCTGIITLTLVLDGDVLTAAANEHMGVN